MPIPLLIPAVLATSGAVAGWWAKTKLSDDEPKIPTTTVVVNNTQDNKTDNIKMILVGVGCYAFLKWRKIL